jgi:predicted GIY-YIG superfamily endonuclease
MELKGLSKYTFYMATSPSGTFYIGMTKMPLETRMKGHKAGAKAGEQTAFHRAIRKHKFESFRWEVLLVKMCTRHEAGLIERTLIKSHDALKKGYNESIGGDGFSGTEETKKKISHTLKTGYFSKPETRLRHSRQRGGKPILVFEAILKVPARGFESKREAKYEKGKLIGKFETQKDACEQLNLLESKVCDILSGNSCRKSHKGFLFEFDIC